MNAYLISMILILSACAKANYQDSPSDAGVLSTAPCEVAFTKKKCSLFLTKQNLCLDIEWQKMQTDADAGSFFLCAYDRSSGASMNSLISPLVKLWMPAMGHGSSPTKIESVSQGIYRVSDVFFVMPGDWEIKVQIKNGADLIDEAVQKISI